MARLVLGTDKSVRIPAIVRDVAPDYYIEYTKDVNNQLQAPTTIMNLSGFTSLGSKALYNAYSGNTNITGAVTFSDLLSAVGENALAYCFSYCTGITSVSAPSLLAITGTGAFQEAFRNCTGITSINLESLESISGKNGCNYTFSGCTNVTNIVLSSLLKISGISSCVNMFAGCTSLTSLSLPSLVSIDNDYSAKNMFNGDTSLANIDLPALAFINGYQCCYDMFVGNTALTTVTFPSLCRLYSSNGSQCQRMFRGCTSLTSLSFPNLAYTTANFNGAISSMLAGVTGCTVHFPAEWQTTMSSWSGVTGGFGGTNTTVLFDLPNVTTLDLSRIHKASYSVFDSFVNNNPFPNITGVDLSGLVTIKRRGFYNAFFNQSNITSVDLSSLVSISGSESVQLMLGGTGITSLSLPALKSIDDASGQMMHTATCTVHLPSNLSGTVVSKNFGSNVTLLFDLPATNILTGADTVEYERNPKYDTATALSWRVNGTMPDATAYYTSGLTDPTVGTTIYSDSACTTAVTTISTIS